MDGRDHDPVWCSLVRMYIRRFFVRSSKWKSVLIVAIYAS